MRGIRTILMGIWGTLTGLVVLISPAYAQGGMGGAFSGVTLDGIVATVVYVLLGLLLFLISYKVIDMTTSFSITKELIEDENAALGTLMAGVAIGLSIIVAAAMV